MRATLALVRAQFIEIRRSKTALFWMTAFPLGFLLLFGFVMARGDARVMAFMMPGLLTTTLMSGSLFGVAFPLVQQRETGMLRRLRVTPVPAAAVAVAHGVTSVAIGLLSLIVLMILARLIFGMQMAGSWPGLVIVYLCGACALVPIGLLVGSTRANRFTPSGNIAKGKAEPDRNISGKNRRFAIAGAVLMSRAVAPTRRPIGTSAHAPHK